MLMNYILPFVPFTTGSGVVCIVGVTEVSAGAAGGEEKEGTKTAALMFGTNGLAVILSPDMFEVGA